VAQSVGRHLHLVVVVSSKTKLHLRLAHVCVFFTTILAVTLTIAVTLSVSTHVGKHRLVHPTRQHSQHNQTIEPKPELSGRTHSVQDCHDQHTWMAGSLLSTPGKSSSMDSTKSSEYSSPPSAPVASASASASASAVAVLAAAVAVAVVVAVAAAAAGSSVAGVAVEGAGAGAPASCKDNIMAWTGQRGTC